MGQLARGIEVNLWLCYLADEITQRIGSCGKNFVALIIHSVYNAAQLCEQSASVSVCKPMYRPGGSA